MKKLLFVMLVIGLFFICCNEETMVQELSTQSIQTETIKPRTLAPSEAIELAQRAAEDFFPAKGRQVSRFAALSNVKIIKNHSSRSNGSDTLMYIVNFNEDAGYAIIGARRDRKNILAVIENGSYDPEIGTDNPGLKLYLSAAEDYLYPVQVPGDTIPVDTIISEEIYPSIEYRDTLTNQQIGPKFNGLAWGQDGFYGKYCPNGITGCVPLAIGSIKSYFGGTTAENFDFPGRPFSRATINWNQLFRHKHSPAYYNTWLCNESDTATVHTGIAANLRQIGKNADASYSYNPKGTGVTRSNAKKEIVRQFSDKKVSDYLTYNFYTIKGALNTGIVYMRGSVQDSSMGHAWVADGFKHLVINYYYEPWNPETNRFDKTEPATLTYRFLHFCWGWHGDDDGWYEGDVLHTSNATLINVEFISICP